jgi:hypothetical protein
MRHSREPSAQTIAEMQKGAKAVGREYQDGDATRHERMSTIRVWQKEGKLRHLLPEQKNGMIDTIVVGDEYFSEPGVDFPSEELFARIGLAVTFGGHTPVEQDW